jgi:hypothetical protein
MYGGPNAKTKREGARPKNIPGASPRGVIDPRGSDLGVRGCSILDRGCKSVSEIEDVKEDACHAPAVETDQKVACGSGWNEKTRRRCGIRQS